MVIIQKMWFVLNANTLNVCTRREQQIDEWNLQLLGVHHCSIDNTKGNTLQKMLILHGGESPTEMLNTAHLTCQCSSDSGRRNNDGRSGV